MEGKSIACAGERGSGLLHSQSIAINKTTGQVVVADDRIQVLSFDLTPVPLCTFGNGGSEQLGTV